MRVASSGLFILRLEDEDWRILHLHIAEPPLPEGRRALSADAGCGTGRAASVKVANTRRWAE